MNCRGWVAGCWSLGILLTSLNSYGEAVPVHKASPVGLVTSLAEAEGAIVRVVDLAPNGDRLPRGTAFFVSPSTLLTCAHVINGVPANTRLELPDGKLIGFVTQKLDLEADVAVLVTALDDSRYFALSADLLPEIGKKVFFAGFPPPVQGQVGVPKPTLKSATISTIESYQSQVSGRSIQKLKLDQPSLPGQSGAPVFTAGSFAVVGVQHATINSNGQLLGYALAIPLPYIRPLLQDSDKLVTTLDPPEVGGVGSWYRHKLKRELQDHVSCLLRNEQVYRDSLAALAKGEQVLDPPAALRSTAWAEVRDDPRSESVLSAALLNDLVTYYQDASRLDDFRSARETFRLSQWALTQRVTILTVHDQQLLARSEATRARATKILESLK